MFVLCFLLWIIINGRITWEVATFGAAVSAAVTLAARKLTGLTREKEWRLFRKFPSVIGYLGFLILEILRANLAVIRQVYKRKAPDPCLKTFTAPLNTTAARVALADSITLTPGTITAEQEGAGFTVHCLDRTMSEGLEDSGFVRRLQAMEKQEAQHEV